MRLTVKFAHAVYKKHYPPSLGDEIWRLERIAKEGAFHTRLASRGIHTVQDFLQLYAIDPSTLRNVREFLFLSHLFFPSLLCVYLNKFIKTVKLQLLGGGVSNRTWDTIIEHANSCIPDDNKLYTYYDAGQRVGFVFNSIYKVVGATFDGQNYEPFYKLTTPQKVSIHQEVHSNPC